jgi:lysophospholipase L1-like esterase
MHSADAMQWMLYLFAQAWQYLLQRISGDAIGWQIHARRQPEPRADLQSDRNHRTNGPCYTNRVDRFILNLMKSLSAAFATILGLFAFASGATAQTALTSQNWVGSWAASQQIPEPHNALATDDLRDATLRQIVHLSVGGSTLRVHVTNAFGTAPLHLTSVHIARPLSTSAAQIDPASDKALTFAGNPDVIIPAGAEYLSDPVEYPVKPLSDLAVSIHYDEPPAQQTGHPGSRATSYFVHGDAVSAADLPDAKKVDHWYQLAGVDVVAPAKAAAIVVLGDSITDGHGATTNGNDRWTDILAQRLQASSKMKYLSVLNHGIGGNHLLIDGLGPNVLARFDRDVLAHAGARYLIVFEGVNDLGGFTQRSDPPKAEHDAFVHRIISSYEQIIERARAAHIKVIGATILPYTDSGYYHPPASNEADRQVINQWIRAAGHFDAVIDFDKALADPEHPDHLAVKYDGGDHLHPNPAGYRAMGELIDLSLFKH